MIIALFFFISSMLFSNFFHYQLNLLLYLSIYRSIATTDIKKLLLPFILLTLEDFLLTDIAGISLIYSIPLFAIIYQAHKLFSQQLYILYTLSCLAGFGMRYATFAYTLGSYAYTGPEIAGNIVVIAFFLIYLIYTLQGRSGNRFYPA